MGTLFRSEEMQLIQLFVQVEAAHDTVDELGRLGLVQFRDLNPDVNSFQRNFVNEVKRADEMERRLRLFQSMLQKEEVVIPGVQVDELPGAEEKLDDLEPKLADLETELLQMNTNQEMLTRNYNELVELKFVLEKDVSFFSEAVDMRLGEQPAVPAERRPLLSEGHEAHTGNLGFLTGVINRDKVPAFERILWRAMRGNLFLKQAEIEDKITDPQTQEELTKNVFIIFYQGERSQLKIKKICESFGAHLYPCPENAAERRELLIQVRSRIEDLKVVRERTTAHRRRVLQEIASTYEGWRRRVLTEKAIYHTMNFFNYDVGRKCLMAEGWCPKASLDEVQLSLRRATTKAGAQIPSVLTVIQPHEEPPTYFRTNKYTEAFQALIDAYGVARYREVNPTPFAIVTFPFLFAVMFGDFGHGILLMLAALALILNEKKLGKTKLNEMVAMCFQGRYLLFLMGIFSIYTGFIYNECFSVPMAFFGSHWTHPGSPYPFGVDPAWGPSKNALNYLNSIKMKMSIILGVSQMLLGIALSAFNAVHFRKPYDFFFEFVPQFLFMAALFGYLVFLVFLKWIKGTNFPGDPPQLLTVMIDIFLKAMAMPKEDVLYGGDSNIQHYVQLALIGVAFVCVPMMLLPKPLCLKRDHSRGYQVLDGHAEEFEFSEVFVHQIIHTIEFILGAISNTASYLRLWALSLAHSELSIVFWNLVMQRMLTMTGGAQCIYLFAGVAVWAGLTLAVLMVMESLSAFLHALRLHWVEFMNKFYRGDGRAFLPFSFTAVMAEADEQQS